jgi:hypothetical protein
VHKENISIAVSNDAEKIVMEWVIATKASLILQLNAAFVHAGISGDRSMRLNRHGFWRRS